MTTTDASPNELLRMTRLRKLTGTGLKLPTSSEIVDIAKDPDKVSRAWKAAKLGSAEMLYTAPERARVAAILDSLKATDAILDYSYEEFLNGPFALSLREDFPGPDVDQHIERAANTLALLHLMGRLPDGPASLPASKLGAWIRILLLLASSKLALPEGTTIRKFLLLPFESDLPLLNADPDVVRLSQIRVLDSDLLVLRKQLKGYDKVEVAVIENVMNGETREHVTKNSLRIEDFTSTVLEQRITDESDEETSERFKLSREIDEAVKEEKKLSASLSVSAKYGEAIEVDADASFDWSQSRELKSNTAVEYAKEVTKKAVKRLENSVKSEQSRRVTKELAETDTRTVSNGSGAHMRGVYQFVEKVYEAQVFNYGRRTMLEFVIPEPSMFLRDIYRSTSPTPNEYQPFPPQLTPDQIWESPASINEPAPIPTPDIPWRSNYYQDLGAHFGASSLPLPPPLTLTTFETLLQPDETATTAATEEFRPRRVLSLKINPVAGYELYAISASAAIYSDTGSSAEASTAGGPWLTYEVAGLQQDLHLDRHMLTEGSILAGRYAEAPIHENSAESAGLAFDPPIQCLDANSKPTINVVSFETANYALTFHLRWRRVQSTLAQWRSAVHAALVTAWDRLQQQKESSTQLRSADEKPAAISPGAKKDIVVAELKKHATALLGNNIWASDSFSPLKGPEVVQEPVSETVRAFKQLTSIGFERLQAYGTVVKFFETAIEWSAIQYAFYPYYWGRVETWGAALGASDDDDDYQGFLRAGAARVVVPIRLGYEGSMSHYLQTARVPSQDDFCSLADPDRVGMLAMFGAPSDYEPVPDGNSWDIRVPTNQVILRASDARELPEWTRDPSGKWAWIGD